MRGTPESGKGPLPEPPGPGASPNRSLGSRLALTGFVLSLLAPAGNRRRSGHGCPVRTHALRYIAGQKGRDVVAFAILAGIDLLQIVRGIVTGFRGHGFFGWLRFGDGFGIDEAGWQPRGGFIAHR